MIEHNLIYNGSLVRERDLPSSLLTNRAFLYGDGLFETLIYRQGEVRYLSDHFARLTRGMEVMDLQAPEGLTVNYVQQSVRELVALNGLVESARVKIQVWRKPGGRRVPSSQEADYLVTVSLPASQPPEWKEYVIFYEDVRLHHSPISAFKTCSSLPYVMAGIAQRRAGADDVILLDDRGHVGECLASNLFWLKDNILFSPSVEVGCIDGIMRKQLLRSGPRFGFGLKEGLFSTRDLLAAETVFCCNAAGVQFIRQIGEARISAGPIPGALRELVRSVTA
jgi:branched-chain amino acid aminotransferase/4-amino-4-deoxychorismate lyase